MEFSIKRGGGGQNWKISINIFFFFALNALKSILASTCFFSGVGGFEKVIFCKKKKKYGLKMHKIT